MRFNIRWQILLAAVAFSLVLSLVSFQVQTAGLCTVQVPASGGTFAEGFVGRPRYLNPLLSDHFPVDREIVSLVFDGLTRYDESGALVPALAQSWSVSEDNLSVLFKLRSDVTWHDGQPFTAADVAFTYGLMQQDEFPGPAELRALWQAVTINEIDDATIEFILPEPYGPFLDATTRGILPAHLLQDLTAAGLADAPFNQTPVGTGPFMVASDQDWLRTRRLRLIPNPVYWRQGTRIANFELRFFPDDEALAEAFTKGEIQAINSVSPEMLPEIAALPGVRLFTAPAPHYTMLLYNLGDNGSEAVRSLEVRQALTEALDREVLVDEALNGQGLPLEGPYPSSSWAYTPQLLTVRETRPLSATASLESAGWLLPENSPVREKDGEPLSLRILALSTPAYRKMAELITGQWSEVGVKAEVTLATDVAGLRRILQAGAFDAALVEIAPPGDPDLYDFWSQEAIIRGQNYGRWNHRRASEALESARKLWNMADRRPYYETFLRYYDASLPAVTLYQQVSTYALSPAVNEAEIGRIGNPRDRYETLANWFLHYRDVTVLCPADGAPGELPST